MIFCARASRTRTRACVYFKRCYSSVLVPPRANVASSGLPFAGIAGGRPASSVSAKTMGPGAIKVSPAMAAVARSNAGWPVVMLVGRRFLVACGASSGV